MGSNCASYMGRKQKDIMMKASINAGLINENTDKSLFFALEPEAASLYCLTNKDIDRNFFKQGEYYIVCDLGGGTGDIVAHLVGSSNHLNEIYPSRGGNFGSNEIDRLFFEEIIFGLFECKDFNTFYSKYKSIKEKNKEGIDDDNELYGDWIELEREIKDFKEGISQQNLEDTFTLNCSLFKDIFEDNIKIDDLLNKFNNKVSDNKLKLNVKNKRKWLIEFPNEIIFNYMKSQSSKFNMPNY